MAVAWAWAVVVVGVGRKLERERLDWLVLASVYEATDNAAREEWRAVVAVAPPKGGRGRFAETVLTGQNSPEDEDDKAVDDDADDDDGW